MRDVYLTRSDNINHPKKSAQSMVIQFGLVPLNKAELIPQISGYLKEPNWKEFVSRGLILH